MKTAILSIYLLIISLLVCIDTFSQPGTIGAHVEESRTIRDLSGFQWKMKRMRPGQGIIEGLHELPPEDIETLVWNPAEVPGDVYTDLWKAGVIDDPYFGRNSAKAQWVMYEEWWYALQFNVTEDLADKVVKLEFDGVDYSCEVWLNGVYLGAHQGAFAPFSFDVSKIVRTSENRLKSQNILMVKLNPPPQVNHKVAGRKTPWFGDYWRDLVPFGIWRPVRLVSTGPVRIDDLYVRSELNSDQSAEIQVEIAVENTSAAPKDLILQIAIEGHNFDSKPIQIDLNKTLKPGLQLVRQAIPIKKPRLWWPWDLGDPNLYLATVVVQENEFAHDAAETTFGIRKITMDWNPGFTKDEVSFPRTVVLNGRNYFIRSAAWGGPPDIFFGRTSKNEYKKLIQLAKEANMNNIRIFGWHPPEIPEFYQYCNEEGITVWQDMIPLGTGNISKDPEFLNGIIEEAVAVAKERRNHPCLILMEGGEEVLLRASDPKFTNDFLIELGDSLQQYLPIPYVPDSPLTFEPALSIGYKPKEAVHALKYFYGMGHALMEDWYQALDYPIVPELAITSVPSVESLKKFIPEDELWPPGLSWGHHWADLDRLRIQNFDAFGEEKTGSLEEFVNATQDAQGIIFQLSVEHFRRNKPRVSGISLCHFITYWPDMKWGIVDNYQQPKRSFEYVKRAYQPLLVSLKFDKRRWKNNEPFDTQIWVVNDLHEAYSDCHIKMRISDGSGNVLAETKYPVATIGPNSSAEMASFRGEILQEVDQEFTVELWLLDNHHQELAYNHYALLIGDQESASKQFKEMGQKINERNRRFSYGNYYRFFPKLTRESDQDWQGETEVPTASGFNH